MGLELGCNFLATDFMQQHIPLLGFEVWLGVVGREQDGGQGHHTLQNQLVMIISFREGYLLTFGQPYVM